MAKVHIFKIIEVILTIIILIVRLPRGQVQKPQLQKHGEVDKLQEQLLCAKYQVAIPIIVRAGQQ